MLETKVTVNNKAGLHTRPASLLVKTAGQFQSKILLVTKDITVDAKSIMGIMALGASQGTEITLQIDGVDEKVANLAMVDLFARNFDEE